MRRAGTATAALLAALLLPACGLITDFSPIDRPDAADDDAADAADDGGPGDAADAGPRCWDGPDPCPSGMAYVPCGNVVIGSDSGEGDSDEEPEHAVAVSAFCIDLTEVSNARYAGCVAASDCTAPRSTASATRSPYYGDAAYGDHPVIHVDWGQAAAYCRSVGKRLPTEAEWEKAARGGCLVSAPDGCGPEDEAAYPWGNDPPSCDEANFVGCVGDTDTAGARAAGAGPYGALDLAGNVQEWVADWYDPAAYEACRMGGCVDPGGPPTGTERVFRGGSWESAVGYLRVANRFRQVPGYSDERLGFRCAADVP